MNNIVRWDLFGETVYEELDFENIPEYIKDNFEDTIAAYTQREENDIFSISELVRDVFYVTTLREISPQPNIESIIWKARNDESEEKNGSFLCHNVDNKEKRHLDVIDKLNGYMMEKFKFECYQAKKKLNEIDNMDEDVKDRENIQRFFGILDDCYSGNQHNLYDELNGIFIRNKSMSDLTQIICDGIGNYCEPEDTYQLFWEWVKKNDFVNDKSRYERKRRLLKHLMNFLGEIEQLCPWVWEQLLTREFLNYFVSDTQYVWCVTRFVNILNDAVMYIQRKVCNLSVIKSHTFYQNEYVKNAIQIMNDNKLDICNSKKCFAIMKNLSTNELFFSISGIDSNIKEKKVYSKVTEALKEVKYHRERLTSEVRYWFQKDTKSNKEVVTYKQCEQLYKNGTKYNRMFSCCERKLLVKPKKNHVYVVYVRWLPCYMCMDDLTYMIRNKMTKGVQIYYGEKRGKETDRELFDRLAETAYCYNDMARRNNSAT